MKIKYVADDGKEFDTEEDCKDYEDDMKHLAKWNHIIISAITHAFGQTRSRDIANDKVFPKFVKGLANDYEVVLRAQRDKS